MAEEAKAAPKKKAAKAAKADKEIKLDIITQIQSDLKVAKDQFNEFSGFNYRSCADILEALKPFLKKHNCHLVIKDKIVLIGERYYLKARIKLMQGSKCLIKTWGYARESLDRKGMTVDMLTGSVSSYARKYALNAMFAIDDSVDADSAMDDDEMETQIEYLTEVQVSDIKKQIKEVGVDEVALLKYLQSESLEKVRFTEHERVIGLIDQKRKQAAKKQAEIEKQEEEIDI